MVVIEEFDGNQHYPDLEKAVNEALETIRIRMRDLSLIPTQTALRMAAQPEFERSLSQEFSAALRRELHAWKSQIPEIYEAEYTLSPERLKRESDDDNQINA